MPRKCVYCGPHPLVLLGGGRGLQNLARTGQANVLDSASCIPLSRDCGAYPQACLLGSLGLTCWDHWALAWAQA